MKTIWIVTICVVAFIIAYSVVIKFIRKKEERNIKDLLYNRHLGDTFEKTMQIVKKTMFEIVFVDGIIEAENYKYIFTHSPSFRTVKMYQFKDNICSGFYVSSYEEKNSLPYWKYTRKYLKLSGNAAYSSTKRDFQYMVAYYTKLQYFDSYHESPIHCRYFRSIKSLYIVETNRLIAVGIDFPLSNRKYPIYSFLCSCSEHELEKLDDFLYINSDNVNHFFELQ